MDWSVATPGGELVFDFWLLDYTPFFKTMLLCSRSTLEKTETASSMSSNALSLLQDVTIWYKSIVHSRDHSNSTLILTLTASQSVSWSFMHSSIHPSIHALRHSFTQLSQSSVLNQLVSFAISSDNAPVRF